MLSSNYFNEYVKCFKANKVQHLITFGQIVHFPAHWKFQFVVLLRRFGTDWMK